MVSLEKYGHCGDLWLSSIELKMCSREEELTCTRVRQMDDLFKGRLGGLLYDGRIVGHANKVLHRHKSNHS